MEHSCNKPFYHQLVETCRSESTKSGTAACRADIIIHHKDTLGYKLPAGIKVKVYDQDGGVYYGQIDDNGDSQHFGVKCGDVSWQLLKGTRVAAGADAKYNHKGDGRQLQDKDEQALLSTSDGYVLLQANAEKNSDPRLQLAKPLQVFVSVNEREVNAIYLPPPILLNLRFRQNHQTRLTDSQINQIKLDGNAATLFIHGYNVSLGELGHFPQAEDFDEIPTYFNLPTAEEVQCPYLYYGEEFLQKPARNIVAQKLRYGEDTGDNPPVKQAYAEVNKQFNGKNALSWFPHVEYYLNLAALGKQNPEANLTPEDWMKYSRIIGVTWSGSVSPSMVFSRAEMYANEAGRELAKVLIQLIDAKIQINVITHSLGARVALAALNILGDYDGDLDPKVDNLIMWEAAVADNAITGNYTREKNPLAMELFPFAHRAVKRMRILYSQGDGVLGGGTDSEDSYGIIGGVYPLKYNTLGGNTQALQDYYQHNLTDETFKKLAKLRNQCLVHPKYRDSKVCMNFSDTADGLKLKEKVRELLETEAQNVSQDLTKPLNYLKPWSHYRRFEVGSKYFEHIIDVLTNQILNNWRIPINDMAVRPALGHQGNRLTVDGLWFNNEPLSEAQHKEWLDSFISARTAKDSENNETKQFWFWDQSNYFISHSAMREFEFKIFDERNVFSRIYKESYVNEILERIMENSKFGRY
ncbi:alpha/beta hydrolase [Actinobacillus equuli]|uniref:alpha/beta hydrolase n=1 Tax=Actinobacillus equuli TaxID=718 RepID=UPI00244241C9|nr:alpha/beta hydrolase [Actinobacillus equuli]WGE53432.1 alpha/beta hydrolase [Actinobacillus equuli subsp. haemolyticus]WGE73867.1 alpha/beta hydrolase [Actinobacillus equuli subsp. haemolyticus]